MSVPKKHHYLPQFFMAHWADKEGKVFEYRRPRVDLIIKRKSPAATGYIDELYSDETKTDPVARQALELVFLQKVDSDAATALIHLDRYGAKPTDQKLRDAWTRFLMSLMHRSPERVKYLTALVKKHEEEELNPGLRKRYPEVRGPKDPPDFDAWLEVNGSVAPNLRVRLLRKLMDNENIGNLVSAMRWTVHELNCSRYGLLTGDDPIMISNGLALRRSFVMLPISPSKVFIAANDKQVIDSFTTQRPNALEKALNDACTRQSQHVIVACDDRQTDFIDRRFMKMPAPVNSSGFVAWDAPIVGL